MPQTPVDLYLDALRSYTQDCEYPGLTDAEEDARLDQLDRLWNKLSEAEKQQAEARADAERRVTCG
jgi:hypothetical protein